MDGVHRVSEGVDWGARTDDNVMALRGDWTEGDVLSLELHEFGEPFYFDATLTFQGDRLESTLLWMPFNRRFSITGSAIRP